MSTVSFLLAALTLPAAFGQTLEEGARCVLSTNIMGTCKKISHCPTFHEGDALELCSLDPIDSSVVMCCDLNRKKPLVLKEKAPVKRISEKMCEKYADLVYIRELDLNLKERKTPDCGAKEEPLIRGGVEAGLKEFPHMVQIGFGDNPISWNCGGSLISDRWVLTAAHCTTHDWKGVASWARVGELDSNDDNDGARPENFRIVDHRVHHLWNGVQLYNDIALFKLERAVTLSSYVRPICLQVEPAKLKESDTVIATGWGHTKEGGESSSHMLKVRINVVNNMLCRQAYSKANRTQLPNGIEQSKQVCAGSMIDGIKDTCQGDSGGPIQFRNANPFCTYTQVGVTSFGRGCGKGIPGVYTRVSHYIDWIESVVWPGQ